MEIKNLINKEDVEIGGKKYFISSIPAIPAQKMLLKTFGALSAGNIAALPPELLSELLSYAGAYNASGAEVQFVDEEIVGMMITDPMDLLELEERMVEKNFGFLGNGRFIKVMERLAAVFGQKDKLAI